MPFPLRRLVVVLGLLSLAARAADLPAAPPLSVNLVLTTQYSHSDIYYRTPPGEGPHFAMTREIVVGQRLDAVAMAHGAVADEAGKVNVVFDVRVRAPDGSTIKDLG